MFGGSKLTQGEIKIFSALLPENVTRYDIVTCAEKVRFTFYSTQSEWV